MKDNLNITLNISGEQLKLTVPREEEEVMREAASQLNQAMRRMQASFKDVSATHAWARVALLFARGYLSAKAANAATEKMLADLESQLDELLLER